MLQIQGMYEFPCTNLPQFLSSAWLGQSGTLSHSGLTLLMQDVLLHSKFPLQFRTGKHDGQKNMGIYTHNCVFIIRTKCSA